MFVFKETLPPEKRGFNRHAANPLAMWHMLRRPKVNTLLLIMFAQQVIFFGFESLLGLFTLTRLGLLGQGNAMIFVLVGVVLVTVQVRYIGPWSRKYGEHRLVVVALGLLAAGLILMALTPAQPHPFYVRQIVANKLLEQAPSGTEAIIGSIAVPLPDETHRGIFGFLWALVAVVPLSIGAGLIRPSLNSLMTRRVGTDEYGTVLGASSALVSAANAAAPIIGGVLFQQGGSTLPFLAGGLLMGLLLLVSLRVVTPAHPAVQLE